MADISELGALFERFEGVIRKALTIRMTEEHLLELFKQAKLFGMYVQQ